MQHKQTQVNILSAIAIANNGTAINKVITKKVGRSALKYTYTQHTFEFDCVEIRVNDKQNKESLRNFGAHVTIQIRDNLVIFKVSGRTGNIKLLTQLNETTISYDSCRALISSPTMEAVIQ